MDKLDLLEEHAAGIVKMYKQHLRIKKILKWLIILLVICGALYFAHDTSEAISKLQHYLTQLFGIVMTLDVRLQEIEKILKPI